MLRQELSNAEGGDIPLGDWSGTARLSSTPTQHLRIGILSARPTHATPRGAGNVACFPLESNLLHSCPLPSTIDENAQCSATCGFRRIAETSIISSGITSPPPAYVLHNTACQALQPTPNCRWQYPVSVSVVTTSLPSRRPACLHIS